MDDNTIPGADAPAQQPTDTQQPEVVETQEASPESDADSQAEPTRKQDVPPVQKRIDQLTWKAHEAERRLNAEIMRRQELESEANKLREQQRELMRVATMPKLEDVGMDPDQYQRAVQQHNERWFQQRQAEQQAAEQQRQQMQARAQFEQSLNARVAEGMQKFPDYAEVIGNPSLPPLPSVNPALLAAILEHEQMPEITYYLGKNPSDAHRIAQMPPARAILEVGKIAATLARSPANQSKAPPPPAQVSGQTANVRRSLEGIQNLDEWMEARQKQLGRRR